MSLQVIHLSLAMAGYHLAPKHEHYIIQRDDLDLVVDVQDLFKSLSFLHNILGLLHNDCKKPLSDCI
jgi:hypothetical protein